MTSKLHARLGATAIAAALALSSTPLLAQQATGDTAQPAPSTVQPTDAAPITTAAPTTDAAPATTPDATATPDAVVSASTAPATHVHRHTAVTSAKSAATTERVATRTVATHHVAPARVGAAAPLAATAAAVPAPAGTAASAPTVAPLSQVAGPPPAAKPAPQQSNRTAEIAGAALFALLVLAAIAYTVARRRRFRSAIYEEEYAPEVAETEAQPAAEAPPAEATPIAEEQPPVVVPERSAFAWGDPQSVEPVQEENIATTALPSGFDLSRFGPHVQAAYRGPSPDNPSLSLRHRLRRAAAMDQAERNRSARAGGTLANGEGVAERSEFEAV